MGKDWTELFQLYENGHMLHRIDLEKIIEGMKEANASLQQYQNALQDIPADQLGEAKKAWLAWEMLDGEEDWYHEYTESLEFDEVHTFKGFVEWAIKLRKSGKDFGELNALIDSVKE